MSIDTRKELTVTNFDILLEISSEQIQDNYFNIFEDNIPYWDRLVINESISFDKNDIFLSGECFYL